MNVGVDKQKHTNVNKQVSLVVCGHSLVWVIEHKTKIINIYRRKMHSETKTPIDMCKQTHGKDLISRDFFYS